LKKAKEHEKRYEWLQAAECYKKAFDSIVDEKDAIGAVDFQEKIAFSLFRAAFQSETNTEFKERMKLAIQAYKKEIKILETSKEKNKQVKIKHAEASVAYTRSWLEENPKKRKKLLDEWWTLGKQVLEAHESAGDTHSVGLVCTDLIEFSQYTRVWLSNFSEEVMLEKEAIRLSEKAIHALSKSNDYYQLARAYCFASIWYSSLVHEAPEYRDKQPQLIQRGYDYSKKALELALPTGDAWLIGCAFYSALTAVVYYNWNHSLGVEYGEKILKYGTVAKDKLLLSYGMSYLSFSISVLAEFMEDPDKQRESFEKARKMAHECVRVSQTINFITNVCYGYSSEIRALTWLAKIETDSENRKTILQNAISKAREGLEVTKEWKNISFILYQSLSGSLSLLSETKTSIEEKKALLLEAQSSQNKHLAAIEELTPFQNVMHSLALYNLSLVRIKLAKIETDKARKIQLLEKAANAIGKSCELLTKELKFRSETVIMNQILGKHSDRRGRILQQIYYLTGDGKRFSEAIETYQRAASAFTKGEIPSHAAESYWFMAQLHGHKGEHQEASKNYESASQSYGLASKKIPQLKDFYKDYSSYLEAWSQIEQARYHHSLEDYQKSQQHYEKAARLHESTDFWSYLTPNYFAWAYMEEAEDLSRKENTKLAKQTFQKAYEQFSIAQESFKQKLEEIASPKEKEMTQKLFEASALRRKYCKARILMEEAKLLDREGKYLQSSKEYGEAAQNISVIVEKMDVEVERKELEYLAILCQAWEKMADAEEKISSKSYLEAAELFEQAKEYCFSSKASFWALGNSNFCRGLAAGVKYQISLDAEEHDKAKGYIKNAATNYLRAGYKHASEYAKATLRLFDAYLFMNQAERESDTEKRVKQYQLAENLLQLAAGSFLKAKQPEKATQVQKFLTNVREEKTLAISLSQVMQAPTIVSTTSSFTAPTPTSEASVGLESFEHANVQANLITSAKEVKVGESLSLSVEFVNAGREPALLMRVEDFIPPDFVVVKKPEIYRIEETCLNMKGKQLAPLKLVEVKLTLQPSRKGQYHLNPKVHYLDEHGKNQSLQLKTLEIRVEEVLLEDRVSTGTEELDSLLLGGIPNEYAVVLAGSPCDEREMIVKNFLKAGTENEETTFYISTEAVGLEGLLENANFYLFLCNPKPKAPVPDLPNVYKLQGTTDLTNLGIALTKAYRSIGKSVAKRRVCVGILSDVLVEYGAKTTRKWIAGLITDLGSKGFTLLAVMDPKEHPTDQATTVLNLFDGEIELTQTEDPLECKKSIRIKKLRNQDYIKNPICLR
jgi:KaiC/GvpD/RAD55 family RecA-like ATPase